MTKNPKPEDRIELLLRALAPSVINKVTEPHHLARESFQIRAIVVPSAAEFKNVVTRYVVHHMAFLGQHGYDERMAFGEAKRILDGAFGDDPYQEGYNVALQMSLRGSRGGLQAVINTLGDVMARRAYGNYLDSVYYDYLDPLSKEDNELVARAFFDRIGPLLAEIGESVDPHLWARDTRAALEYLRQALENMAGNAWKV